MESTDTSQSMSPTASLRAWAASSIREKVPSNAHLRKRVYNVRQDPYLSGTSRQAEPVRSFHTIPFSTTRSSRRGRPVSALGSSLDSTSHSSSESSCRRTMHYMMPHQLPLKTGPSGRAAEVRQVLTGISAGLHASFRDDCPIERWVARPSGARQLYKQHTSDHGLPGEARRGEQQGQLSCRGHSEGGEHHRSPARSGG